jgi:hypothetical protein
LLPLPFWPPLGPSPVSTSWSAKSSETPSSSSVLRSALGNSGSGSPGRAPQAAAVWRVGGVGTSPLQVHQLLRPLLEQPVGLVAQARYLGALAITERRGIGEAREARCLAQQQPGALLHEARAIADGVGQVPQPRARGLVERREADGLQVVFKRKLTSHLKSSPPVSFSRRASRHRLPWSCTSSIAGVLVE